MLRGRTEKLLTRVKELSLPTGHYVIFGSGPMAVRGLRGCKDIDIVVTADVFSAYKNRPGWEAKKFDEHTDYLENDGIELWDTWGPGEWDIGELIKKAEQIDGLPFVQLETMLEWKKLCGRPKDLKDVKITKEYFTSRK